MQQLETYNLKHIDRDDTFSPDTLNDNTDAVAAALARIDDAAAAEKNRVDGEFARVDGDIATIPKIAANVYAGDSTSPRTIPLPFTPKIVLVTNETGCIFFNDGYPRYHGGLALEGRPAVRGSTKYVEIMEGGFQVYHRDVYESVNCAGKIYRYIAIG